MLADSPSVLRFDPAETADLEPAQQQIRDARISQTVKAAPFSASYVLRDLNKPHHDRCKPRSHGGSEKGALGVRPLLGRPMAMYTLVTLAARAGIDRVRKGSQDSGTRRRRTEKSGSRRDHQDQAGSTGLNNTARQQSGGRPQGRHEA